VAAINTRLNGALNGSVEVATLHDGAIAGSIARVSVGVMKHLAFVIVIALASTAYAGIYADNKQTATQDCSKDPDAIILGNNNTVTLTGTCKRVVAEGNSNTLRVASAEQIHVRGNKNTVVVEAADAISTPGNENTVTWTKGLTAEKPKVSNPGNRNKIGSTK
jgi:hypothetical protein